MQRSVRRLIHALVLTALVAVFAPPPSAADALPDDHQRTIAVAADYLSISSRGVDRILTANDYHPPLPANAWRRTPAIRKLELAYLSAVKADPQDGGDRFLALLAHNLARQHESARNDPALRKHLKTDDPFFIDFEPLTELPKTPILPAETRPVIAKLAEYSSVGPNPITILTADFGLTHDEAYTILSSSASIEDALAHALGKYSPSVQRPKLTAAINRLAGQYESARYERVFQSFVGSPAAGGTSGPGTQPPFDGGPRASGPFAGGPPHNGGDGPGGGGGFEMPRPQPPGSGRNAKTAYESFDARSYPTSESRAFERMSIRIGGFGGVVFGNTVDAVGLSAPKTIAYSANNAAAGKFVITFADRSPLTLDDVTADEAWAAYHIFVAHKPAKDQGVGLVGLSGIDYRDCPNGKSRRGQAYNVVLHPALANRDLGWAAIYADALPITDKKMLSQLADNAPDTQALRSALGKLTDGVINWKITDAPLEITAEGGRIHVGRTSKDSSYPEGLRRMALIEFRPFFGAMAPDAELMDELYWNVPALLAHFVDYRKLNSFAATAAVVRWVIDAGGRFDGAVPQPSSVATPDAILITSDDAITPISALTKADMERGDANRCRPAKSTKSKSAHKSGKR